MLPPPFYSDSRGRLSLQLENKRLFSPAPKERCGVWDTVASVPTTFLLLFSSPEKRRYPFKASHSGRGGTACRDGEGLLLGRANTVRPYHAHILSYKPRRGDLWSPAEQSHRLLAVARSHLPCKAKEAFLRSQKFITKRNHSHCRDRRPRLSE